MIVAFSTSSEWASVAAISTTGDVLWEGQERAPRRAGAACLKLIESMPLSISDASIFAADIGPGSFTGVRVGVILAKTFGYVYDKPVCGADAFDLISVSDVVALPSKKGEYFVRVPGREPYRTESVQQGPILGYGAAFADPTPPHAKRFGALVSTLAPMLAEAFVPEYLIQPSISTPKKPYARSST
ncbi:MAG: tRNA (adenosine(37)-N6)-threonylcarbamoyltransferase complex dimerization subunit type 1 TsaB [Fimbriimonas sp.]